MSAAGPSESSSIPAMNMIVSHPSDARPAAWSAIEHDPLPPSIHALMDATTAAFPDRLFWSAIDGNKASLSYAEFARLTMVAAARLRDLGVEQGSHVAIMMPNCEAFLASWLALNRLGAVAVMINTASTSAELERMLRTTDATHFIVDTSLLLAYQGIDAGARPMLEKIIVHGDAGPDMYGEQFASWADLLAGEGLPADSVHVDIDDIASIQFTSGSSGIPKACLLSHRYWLTLGKSRSAIGPKAERMLIDSPMFYMGPSWRIILAIYSGATLFVATKFSLSQLFDRILDYRIDFCSVTYPVAKLEHDPRLANNSLKFVTTYGLSKELHVALEERFGVPVREIYGMTEVGSVISMPTSDLRMVGSGSCGVPAPFRRVRIVRDGKDVATGESGELWVAGPGLFSGYYKNPEATDASYEGEWFKTGDLFSCDENGYYTMLGRIKDVIRRSGENISAAEIELTLNALDGVLETAAIPVKDSFRGEEVKVVVARSPGELGARLTPEIIIDACKRALAPFKVPRYVELVDALPKTGSGKIDKNVLKAATHDGAQVHDTKAGHK